MARQSLKDSELILNDDGSIYHLHLHPDQIADHIITVGDQNRVAEVSKYFDRIDLKVRKREFVTHTGEINGKRLTVISTGIGPDNIDIVFNELDALANINLKTREIKEHHTPLRFIRIGTSGSLQSELEVDQFLFSAHGIGLDNLLSFYHKKTSKKTEKLNKAFSRFLSDKALFSPPFYSGTAGAGLLNTIAKNQNQGITLTCPGFYGPQGRSLRLTGPLDHRFLDGITNFKHEGFSITNFEMETAAMYGLANLLGHEAISCNAILANRINGTFSPTPYKTIDQLIKFVLEKITTEI
ncbi:MAG: nucleoside phosphorylase [Bacteroidetes bacterium]|nr:nucleoside phosphorylase [Bacteroidota bacterium]